jgi:hypothetical protein
MDTSITQPASRQSNLSSAQIMAMRLDKIILFAPRKDPNKDPSEVYRYCEIHEFLAYLGLPLTSFDLAYQVLRIAYEKIRGLF